MKVPRALAFGVQPSRCSFEVHAGTYEKIRENSLAYSMFGVRCSMFDVFSRSISQQSPYSTTVFAFSTKIELSPTFRLDGGTVPRQKSPRHFQKPHILRGYFSRNFAKKRTVLFDGPKFTFLHSFSTKKRAQSGILQDGNCKSHSFVTSFPLNIPRCLLLY
jgi:hypothetical protein